MYVHEWNVVMPNSRANHNFILSLTWPKKNNEQHSTIQSRHSFHSISHKAFPDWKHSELLTKIGTTSGQTIAGQDCPMSMSMSVTRRIPALCRRIPERDHITMGPAERSHATQLAPSRRPSPLLRGLNEASVEECGTVLTSVALPLPSLCPLSHRSRHSRRVLFLVPLFSKPYDLAPSSQSDPRLASDLHGSRWRMHLRYTPACGFYCLYTLCYCQDVRTVCFGFRRGAAHLCKHHPRPRNCIRAQ